LSEGGFHPRNCRAYALIRNDLFQIFVSNWLFDLRFSRLKNSVIVTEEIDNISREDDGVVPIVSNFAANEVRTFSWRMTGLVASKK
jgi:hypothetical protein